MMELHLPFDNLTKEEADTLIGIAKKYNDEGTLFFEGWSHQPMESVLEEERERR
jgi:hypothetical protein